jgi:hypothetical protein
MSATQSMRCTTVQEVLLLLKSSDQIAHDLNHAYVGVGVGVGVRL